jgi:hypothetical protein
MRAVKQIPPWSSLPDTSRPLQSEPPVWKVEEHRELAKRLEKSLLKAPETDHIRFASASPRALKGRPPMRRTLLAVGFAVLVSMMLAPHGGKHGIEGWAPFFSETGFEASANEIRFGDVGRVMIDMLALEIVFLAVLFALVVNTNWRRWKPRPSTLKNIAVFLLIFTFLACAALWL